MKKSYNAFVYQGEGKSNRYFEGWYYRITDKSEKSRYAVIPGISRGRSPESSHCFIQILDGFNCTSYNIKYDLKDFSVSRDGHIIRIGDSYFTQKGMILDINQDSIKMEGRLNFKRMYLWPSNFKEPNSMGWYSHVPFMECYHGILSLNHSISGSLTINEASINFEGGRGYMEKDWGKSFPSSWIWLQCNHFDKSPVSLSLSIGKIPFLGTRFTGFIAGLLVGKKLFRFTTYTGAKLKDLRLNKDRTYILLQGKRYELEILADRGKTGTLFSPKMGVMEGKIEESMEAGVRIRMYDRFSGNRNVVFESMGRNGGLEIMGVTEELLST